MSERIVNACRIHPNEIESGDVMLYTVKAMVVRKGAYRLYCCLHNDPDPIPQGVRIRDNEEEVCFALFPTLARVAVPDTL